MPYPENMPAYDNNHGSSYFRSEYEHTVDEAIDVAAIAIKPLVKVLDAMLAAVDAARLAYADGACDETMIENLEEIIRLEVETAIDMAIDDAGAPFNLNSLDLGTDTVIAAARRV